MYVLLSIFIKICPCFHLLGEQFIQRCANIIISFLMELLECLLVSWLQHKRVIRDPD